MAKVKDPTRDWEALERKLRAGKTVDQAADECGIPLEDLDAYFLTGSPARKHDAEGQRRATSSALQTGLRVLRKVAKAGPRFIETTYSPSGKPQTTVKPESVDVDAAKALLRYAGDMTKRPPAPVTSTEQKDLFDGGVPEGLMGPWCFKAGN